MVGKVLLASTNVLTGLTVCVVMAAFRPCLQPSPSMGQSGIMENLLHLAAPTRCNAPKWVCPKTKPITIPEMVAIEGGKLGGYNRSQGHQKEE